MCNRNRANRLSPAARAAAQCNRQQALRNRALYEAGALPGLRPCNGRGTAANGAVATSSCGSRERSLTQELYAGTTAAVETQTCCDPACGCRRFDASCRNSYWPSFCHPRWLTCNELYQRRRP